jgi:diaminopimelate decarboxylase
MHHTTPFGSGLLERREGALNLEKVPLVELASKFGTPLFILSETRIRENYNRLYKAFHDRYEKVRIYYAAKANTGLSVLAIMREEGAYLDVVSPGELYLALKTGFSPERLLYTGVSVSDEDMQYALKSNVTINVDSLSQMEHLLKMNHQSVVSVRVNPEVGAGHHEHCVTGSRDSKFGLLGKDVVNAYRMAKEAGIERFGIQMHIGSGILNIEPYLEAMTNFFATAEKVSKDLGIGFEFMDLGGGFGVPYRPEEQELDIEQATSRLVMDFKKQLAERQLGEPILCVEPGRYIVSVKKTPFKEFVNVDAGFNTLIRPAMYGSYHEVLLANTTRPGTGRVCDVVGPLCESGDFIARDRRLEEVRQGDVLAVLNVGAYGFVMSSQYNSRPRPAEILVKNGRYTLVREREDFETLVKGQRMAEWLQ